MATRKKERYHKTGKSNKKSCYFHFSDYENIDSNPRSSSNEKENFHKREVLLNTSELAASQLLYKSHGHDEDTLSGKFSFAHSDKWNNQLLKDDKNWKRSNEMELIQLKKKPNSESDTYFKGTPCKFKKNVGKKKIDNFKLHIQDNVQENTKREIDVSELWNYLSHVHNSEGNRLRRKVNDLICKRDGKNEQGRDCTNRQGENFRKVGDYQREENCQKQPQQEEVKREGRGVPNREESINYDEYKSVVKYVLPGMADNKIKYSWFVLKNNLKSEKDEVNYEQLFNFINDKAENDKSAYVNKIVCSKLKNKMLKYNFNPSDVKLKTINYIDNVRLKASEFSKEFKELISEEELKNLFQGKEKIKLHQLEKDITKIIAKKTRIDESVDVQNDSEKVERTQKTNTNGLSRKKEGLTDFNIKAYLSTLLTNKDEEVLVKHFIDNLNVDYETLNSQNRYIKDAYDFYSRPIPPTEVFNEAYANELNKEEVKRAKYLIEEIDFSVRNNFKSNYVSAKGGNNGGSGESAVNGSGGGANGSGGICNSRRDPGTSYLSLYEIFKHLDTDKDSYITKEDLHKSFSKLKIRNITNDDVTILLKYIDTERKGYINVNDFLSHYQLEEKSMINWIKNTNKPYFDFVKNLKRKTCKARSISESVINNKNASTAKSYDDAVYNYNLELDPFCPSYVIRERIRDNFIAKKEDFLNKHINATRFHLTSYKNTNNLVEPVENSDLYMNDNLRFKTTYNMNYS
ncbi:calcium-binding protein, putative [Plasmodium ovale wallikeri]|uniref:Calcium-binding protein, putative n=2 Tax=Plasmodium ovale TaxID=36330 RepID=A0A1A8YWN9_PLAOA|nr:calcium-binding protein, putative [Plasmodium ovale wallikeri]SBT36116.1 calcium-binding protein, putative [Plasmodium ovale wallikeri]SBT77258.1 calcium-binding protein, putative [Plasmodium ovale]